MIHGRDGQKTLLLNSHLDTAAACHAGGRRSPVPSGQAKTDRLYGPGASDCKAGLAAQIYAGRLLKSSLLPLDGSLIVAATVAEENGGSAGVRALLERTLPDLNMTPTYAVLGEPTNLGLYYGHDGWAELEVRIEGENPFQVDDAAHAVFGELDTMCQMTRDGSEAAGRIGLPRFEDVNGGRRAVIGVSRHLDSAEGVGHVLHRMESGARTIASAGGSVAVAVSVRRENQRLYTGRTAIVERIINAWSTDPFHPLMERARHGLSAAGCTAPPGKWELRRPGMGTAGGVLLNEFKIPTIGYGPGLESVAHSKGEYVETDKISEAVYGTAAIAHALIGVPVFGWTSDEI